MRNRLLSILLLFALFALLIGRARLVNECFAQTGPVKISSTSYLNRVAEKMKQPGVTAEEAAEYANALLAKNGFDYFFDACSIVKANPHPREIQDKYGLTKIYTYSLVQNTGRKIKFQLTATEGLCSECYFEIPLLRVTRRELLVLSQGKQYLLKRPAGFVLKEISLVDPSLKKALRTWEVPLDTELAGVSEDGTRIYLELLNNYTEDMVNKIVLEVSQSTVRFRARSQVAARDGEFIKDHPIDPLDAYLAFKRFRVGKKEYIIRYDVPCT